MKNNEKTKEGRLDELQKLRTRFEELEASNAELQKAQKTLLARLDMFRFNRMEQMLRESEEELAPSISMTIPIRLTIAENGAGFDPAAAERPDDGRGWGLISMRERAHSIGAHFRVDSSPGKGTKVIVEVHGC